MMRKKDGALQLEVCNDTASSYTGRWEIADGETGKVIARGEAEVAAGKMKKEELAFTGGTDLVLLKWECGGKEYRNHLLMREEKSGLLEYCRKFLLPWYQAEGK